MNAAKNTIRALPQNLHNQRGASLLEGIAYLGIAAIVILGAVSLLTGAFSSAQSNQASEETTAIRTAVRKLYLGQGYGVANTSLNATLATARALPGTLVVTTSGATTNVWGGSVTIVSTGTGTFTITYPNVPQDVCLNTLVGASGWQSVAVGGGTAVTTFPVPPTLAGTTCSGTANSMVFTSL